MPDWNIGRLSTFNGNRQLFCSGDPALDGFFHDFAGQYERRGVGATWVARPRDDDQRPVGYYTSAASSVPFVAVPIKLPRHPVPTILIARLAVDLNYRKQGLGEHLILHALRRAVEVARETAVWAVTVDAYEAAAPFYSRYGFEDFLAPPPLPGATRSMFLTMQKIRKMPL